MIKENYLNLGLTVVEGVSYVIFSDPDLQWLFMAHPTKLVIESQITVKQAIKVSNSVTGRSNWLDRLVKESYKLYITFTHKI